MLDAFAALLLRVISSAISRRTSLGRPARALIISTKSPSTVPDSVPLVLTRFAKSLQFRSVTLPCSNPFGRSAAAVLLSYEPASSRIASCFQGRKGFLFYLPPSSGSPHTPPWAGILVQPYSIVDLFVRLFETHIQCLRALFAYPPIPKPVKKHVCLQQRSTRRESLAFEAPGSWLVLPGGSGPRSPPSPPAAAGESAAVTTCGGTRLCGGRP